MENLCLLTDDECAPRSPFAMILCRQPLLRDRLTEPGHYVPAQRNGLRIRLRPITEAGVGNFIAHDLKAAGAARTVFELETTAAICQKTRGIPRLVQNLALGAALAAMVAGNATIDVVSVQQAVVHLEDL